MKNLIFGVILILAAVSVIAEKNQNEIKISDFDEGMQGFSFSSGGLLDVNPEAEKLTRKVDFIFDMPNGLGMNNTELDSWFQGDGMILDLGEIPIDSKADIDEDAFSAYLIPDEILQGHTYLIKTAKTGDFGRIHIINFDLEYNLLTFRWVYLDSK